MAHGGFVFFSFKFLKKFLKKQIYSIVQIIVLDIRIIFVEISVHSSIFFYGFIVRFNGGKKKGKKKSSDTTFFVYHRNRSVFESVTLTFL